MHPDDTLLSFDIVLNVRLGTGGVGVGCVIIVGTDAGEDASHLRHRHRRVDQLQQLVFRWRVAVHGGLTYETTITRRLTFVESARKGAN